jgi:hypothetical protein
MKDLIELALKCGAIEHDTIGYSSTNTFDFTQKQLAAFAEAIRAEERAAIAASAQDADWIALTDADRERAFNSLPDMLDGFLKKWGWLHFAQAIEDICREKNAMKEPKP